MLTLRGVKVFVLVEKGKPALEKITGVVFILALPLWTAQTASTALGHALIPAPLFWSSPAPGWIGIALYAAGLVLFAAALVSFGSAWRVGIDEGGGRLVTSGAFALSRNPIYLFMDICFLGIFLVYPNLFFLLSFVLAALGFHWQILKEEKSLLSRFGDRYAEYCLKVKRYI
jgi:protein-S-isoprenylcysteine O-methyltransferase Ste14